jgi:hypothetical protein
LEHDLVGKDIAVFVSHRLESVLVEDHEEFRQSLASMIYEKSRGLFLYTRLLLDQLIPNIQTTEQIDIGELASGLPACSFSKAESLKIETSIQVFFLECVTHASRPLRLNELASALASTFPIASFQGNPKAVARLGCAPLLEILEGKTIQLIHHSFTEFLLDASRSNSTSHGVKMKFPSLDVEKAHKKLTMTYLNYLQSGGLKSTKQLGQGDPTSKESSNSCRTHSVVG